MYLNYTHHTSNAEFKSAIIECLSQLDKQTHYVRLIFFGAPLSNDEYKEQYDIINNCINQHLAAQKPAFSYIAQMPINGSTVLMEAHAAMCSENEIIMYKLHNDSSYVIIQDSKRKALFVSGLTEYNYHITASEQSRFAFDKLQKILELEHLQMKDIVRQWNYIEDITGFDDTIQRYQAFNDIRTNFYGTCQWENGYPAATGIGMSKGGIIIDADIMSGYENAPIDNPLQKAAYAYSKKVLVGETEYKSTPKFERARSVIDNEFSMKWIYISGTAAIKGEETLEVDIRQQTLMTLDNIEQLVQQNTKYMRVYVKYPSDYSIARNTIQERYPNIDAIFVNSNVCRDNLLIEIEGIAYN